MKQFNLQSFETHPDGSVILYGRDNRQIRITRGPKGTRVETATAHTGTYFWGDDAMDAGGGCAESI